MRDALLGMVVFFVLLAFVIGFGLGMVVGRQPKTVSSVPLMKSARAQMAWQKNEKQTLYAEYNPIGSDGLIYATVMKGDFSVAYMPFVGGAGYGEFTTLNAAERRAEEVVARQNK